jgi:hypothetical protein
MPRWAIGPAILLLLIGTACSAGHSTARQTPPSSAPPASSPAASSSAAPIPTDTRPPGEFTFAFAGDVNFADRTATRLATDPSTAFGVSAPVGGTADLTMVNLETAITTAGDQQNKSFTFRAPPTAFTALRDAGVDIATMANNHGADYGASGLQDTLAAISAAQFPVVGIGANAAAAYAPYVTTVRGTRIAVIAASQVQDETLAHFSAGPTSPGIANAFSPLLIAAVRAAKADGDLVITYIHWGTEYDTCPNSDQRTLAAQLAAAGATAVIGTHAHVLQGAGWRPDGVYVAYGLGNYLWWMSFGNNQDDNGVLTLTFRDGKVVSDAFAPSRLDATGVPVPATGDVATHINAEWATARGCANLAATPPA